MSTALDIDRRMLVVPAVALVLAALLGYLLGHQPARAPVRANEPTSTTSVAGVLLQVPARWRSAANSHEIPGLQLNGAVSFAPGGNAAAAGLVVGALPSGQPSPLPSAMLARLRGQPTTSVVELQEAQAYRYTNLSIAGSTRAVAIYVVPSGGSQPTVLACYASPAQVAELATCQRIVAALTLVGRTQTYDLTPQPEYARQLSAAVATLDAARSSLRTQMAASTSTAHLKQVAEALAGAFAHAAGTLSGLETTLANGAAQSALSGAMLQAHSAYTALAKAAGRNEVGAYGAARGQVEAAESAVNGALQAYSLLGYRSA
ncbi:MAG TPA: hypothetical protein VGX51_00725 [Solirubrobacteraceae bacterium]|jgi:hypothetical protein|nr:hypothetical protein [Solirubrobacteraceae bacterium]